ncbi:MAG TPA: DegT/DnrJ/EryC1/StrS aminotransferase family protein [Rhodocyclaceae bacterium]
MIPHNRPTLGEAEAAAAARVLASGWVAQGPEVAAFEDEMCTFLGLPAGHAVAVSSGSAALYLALLALRGQGQRVALPAYSCRALWNAIALAGGTAAMLDTAPGDAAPAAVAWTAGNTPVAILAHMYGIPAPLPDGYVGAVIEDCAQALGATVAGRPAGLNGAAGVFSFGATKPITSGGQGGMVVSRDAAVIDFVRAARDYDTVLDALPRFNFQMTDLQAAIGRVQLSRLPEFIARRAAIYAYYRGAGLPLLGSDVVGAMRFRAVLRTDDPLQAQQSLAEAGVRAIVPVTGEELLAPPETLPNAARLCASTLSLPVYPSLSDAEVEHIAAAALRSLAP